MQRAMVELMKSFGRDRETMEKNAKTLVSILETIGMQGMASLVKIGADRLRKHSEQGAQGADAKTLALIKGLSENQRELLAAFLDAVIKVSENFAKASEATEGRGTIAIQGGREYSAETKTAIVGMVRKWRELKVNPDTLRSTMDMLEGSLQFMGVDTAKSDLATGKVVMVPSRDRVWNALSGAVQFLGGLVAKLEKQDVKIVAVSEKKGEAPKSAPQKSIDEQIKDKRESLKKKENELKDIKTKLEITPAPSDADKAKLKQRQTGLKKEIEDTIKEVKALEQKKMP